MKFFASCPRGTEDLLLNEIAAQGIIGAQKTRGGASFKCPPPKAFELLMQSRIASRVFMKIEQFQIRDEADLYEKARTIPWEDYLTVDDTFKFSALLDHVSNTRFRNSLFLSYKIKDALVDRMNDKFGSRPSVDLKFPEFSFLLRIESNGRAFEASVLLDLCGNPLSGRGYRERGHEAPIRENLAAAMVLSSDFSYEEDSFIDLMCGTGTILIEAALIRGRISPSYLHLRRYIERDGHYLSFLKHQWFRDDKRMVTLWKEMAHRIHDDNTVKFKDLKGGQFAGSDLDFNFVSEAKDTVRKANLSKIIEINQADARKELPKLPAPGIVMCNPPYGERLGQDDDIAKLYHDFTENLKQNYKGFRAYIIAERTDKVKAIDLKPSRKIELWNGPIECRLFKYDLY